MNVSNNVFGVANAASLDAENDQFSQFFQKFLAASGLDSGAYACAEFPTIQLGEVCSIRRSNGSLNKDYFTSVGLPYIQYGQIHKDKFTTATDQVITYIAPIHCAKVEKARKGEVIITDVSEDIEGLGKSIVWMGNDEVVTSQHLLIAAPKQNKLDSIYLAYFLTSYNFFKQKRRIACGTSLFQIYAKDFEKCLIPLPPLEVQKAIATFLQQLEEIIANKCFGVAREIELRQQQFEFYFHKLISFGQNSSFKISENPLLQHNKLEIPKYKISELCNLIRGSGVYKTEYIQEHSGDYPVFSSKTTEQGEIGRIDTYDYDGEYLTWTTDGVYAGTVFHRNGKFSITSHAGLLEIKQPNIISYKFLYFMLKSVIDRFVNKTANQPMIGRDIVGEITVPVPPMEIQQQVVDFLWPMHELLNNPDYSFDKCIALSEQLRQYYNDKLFEL